MAGGSVGARLGGLRRLAAQRRSPAPPRLATSWWPLLQGPPRRRWPGGSATQVLDHREPFFAPVSAVVALNATLGECGLNALRLLLGVVVGILVGELTI